MANYICPVCGKNCGNLKTLNVCVNQHIENEEKENKEKAKKIVDMKQNAIRKKSEELKILIKEFNELPDNPYTATYTLPTFTPKKVESTKKGININKEAINTNRKEVNNKTEIDLDKMLNDISKKIKNTKSLSEKEDAQLEKDLDTCLNALLRSLFL